MKGTWQTKNQNMMELCKEVRKLKENFVSFEINHIRRVLFKLPSCIAFLRWWFDISMNSETTLFCLVLHQRHLILPRPSLHIWCFCTEVVSSVCLVGQAKTTAISLRHWYFLVLLIFSTFCFCMKEWNAEADRQANIAITLSSKIHLLVLFLSNSHTCFHNHE